MTLATFVNKLQVPPGGVWFFVDKETGTYFQSNVSLNDLVRIVKDFLITNKRDVPNNLAAIIEDYICRNSPKGLCYNQTESKPRFDFFSVLRFTEVFFNKIRALATGKKDFLVPIIEAEQRAKICIECPKNLKHICTTCNGLRNLAAKLVANRRTKFDNQLGVCEICGCVLAAKIHVNKKYLSDLSEVPEFCWLNK